MVAQQGRKSDERPEAYLWSTLRSVHGENEAGGHFQRH